jgi:hypothetical protein
MTVRLPQLWLCAMIAIALAVPASGRLLHGSGQQTLTYKNWHEALENIPCDDVTKVEKGYQITVTIIVAGETHEKPIISDKEKDKIEILEKHCPQKRGCSGGLTTMGVGC